VPWLAQTLFALVPKARHRVHAVGEEDLQQQLWGFVEEHGQVIFPLLALTVIVLIVLGVRRGMLVNQDELREKEELKDSLVRMMREKLLVSPDAAAADLRIDRFRAAALLDELVREGKLLQQRGAGGIATYRLKGL